MRYTVVHKWSDGRPMIGSPSRRAFLNGTRSQPVCSQVPHGPFRLGLLLLVVILATPLSLAQDPQKQYQLAISLLEKGDYAGAEEAIGKVLSRYPNLPEALTVAGISLQGQGQNAEAIPLLEKALKQKPGLLGARSTLARAYVGIGQYGKALPHSDQALQSQASDQYFYEWLGLFLLDQTRGLTGSQVEETFGRYVQTLNAILGGDVSAAETQLAGLQRLPATKGLLARLTSSKEERHRNVGFWVAFLLSKVQFARGEAALALQSALALGTLFPNEGRKLHMLGLLLLDQGHNREALPLLEKAMELTGKDPEKLQSLGMSYGLSMQHRKAIQLFEEAVRLKPEEPTGYWLLAVGYGLLGRLPEAEKTLKKLLSLDPGHLEGRHHLGRTFYRQGRLEEAQTQFRQVLDRSADHVDALYHQALIRYRQRDYGTSQKLLTRVLALDSQHISAHYKLAQVLQKLGQKEESNRFLGAFKRLRKEHEAKTQSGPRIYGTTPTAPPAFLPPR